MISLCVRYVALIFVVVFTECTSTEREQLAFCLGKYKKDSIVKDCVEVSSLFKDIESKRKAMNRNWCNQKANPALNTKTGNK